MRVPGSALPLRDHEPEIAKLVVIVLHTVELLVGGEREVCALGRRRVDQGTRRSGVWSEGEAGESSDIDVHEHLGVGRTRVDHHGGSHDGGSGDQAQWGWPTRVRRDLDVGGGRSGFGARNGQGAAPEVEAEGTEPTPHIRTEETPGIALSAESWHRLHLYRLRREVQPTCCPLGDRRRSRRCRAASALGANARARPCEVQFLGQ